MDTAGIIGIIEGFGVPLAILTVIFFIIYKFLPKLLEEYKSMNNNITEVIKTNTQAMTELRSAMKSADDLNRSSFERIHVRIDTLADKDNLERLHIQLDKIEKIILNLKNID